MLHFSSDQIGTLAAQRLQGLQARVLTHVRRHLPQVCAQYEPFQLETVVGQLLRSAAERGIRKEANQVVLVDVMLCAAVQGSPALKSRLMQILDDPALGNEQDRIEVLLGAALREPKTQTQAPAQARTPEARHG